MLQWRNSTLNFSSTATLRQSLDKVPQEELMRCRAKGVKVSDVVDFFEKEAGKVVISHVHPSWFTFTDGFQRGDATSIAKRLFDVTMSFLLLMVAWPFMLLTVLAIWIEDGFGAPIFYKQRRVGVNGRIYEVIKFRSMTVDAAKILRGVKRGSPRVLITRETYVTDAVKRVVPALPPKMVNRARRLLGMG